VDQVPTRCNAVSERLRFGGCSDVGVEGGVFVEAKTSNWRDRYAREFISDTEPVRGGGGCQRRRVVLEWWWQWWITVSTRGTSTNDSSQMPTDHHQGLESLRLTSPNFLQQDPTASIMKSSTR
jgi:hypothetical protein